MIGMKTVNKCINSVRNLQILDFSRKNKKIKSFKNGEKKRAGLGSYTYYCYFLLAFPFFLFFSLSKPGHNKIIK